MPFGYTAAVPPPNALVEGRAPLYTRQRTYVTSAGAFEGARTEVMLYNASGLAVKGGVYRMVLDGDEETNPSVADVTAQTVAQYFVVALRATPDATWDWFAIEGYVDALVDGTAALDDFLKVASANADALISDTATITTSSLGRLTVAHSGAETLTKVYLYGERAICA